MENYVIKEIKCKDGRIAKAVCTELGRIVTFDKLLVALVEYVKEAY